MCVTVCGLLDCESRRVSEVCGGSPFRCLVSYQCFRIIISSTRGAQKSGRTDEGSAKEHLTDWLRQSAAPHQPETWVSDWVEKAVQRQREREREKLAKAKPRPRSNRKTVRRRRRRSNDTQQHREHAPNRWDLLRFFRTLFYLLWPFRWHPSVSSFFLSLSPSCGTENVFTLLLTFTSLFTSFLRYNNTYSSLHEMYWNIHFTVTKIQRVTFLSSFWETWEEVLSFAEMSTSIRKMSHFLSQFVHLCHVHCMHSRWQTFPVKRSKSMQRRQGRWFFIGPISLSYFSYLLFIISTIITLLAAQYKTIL